ncbi:DUF6364 family protein [Mongoliitalea daihaiensis]|uniref:DUF6364 family protein n=1 Tax=Mongoliitalea daihaiensis TaxID=2782006 RepID=UPI0021D41CE8|nr:DUF6364 family protein [Mongoliitalea daihaiensis]UJP66426.1 hypothetical protein IPZ59_07445 [Mongoliitalea daihaiensis]
MKKRLNITIDKDTLTKIKRYADEHDLSVSSIVEEHFEALLKPTQKQKNQSSLIALANSLPPTKITFPTEIDWKKNYQEAKRPNHEK